MERWVCPLMKKQFECGCSSTRQASYAQRQCERSYEDTWHEAAQLEHSHITSEREKGGRTVLLYEYVNEYTSMFCIDVIVDRLTEAEEAGEEKKKEEATEGG